MSVIVKTSTPNALMRSLKEDITDGVHAGWEVDSDGDLTLSSAPAGNRAWLRPRIGEGQVVFNVLSAQNERMSSQTYAMYHSKLVHLLLLHYDERFESASCSALPTKKDSIGT